MSKMLNEGEAGYTAPNFEPMPAGTKINGSWGYIPPTAKWSKIIPVVVEEDSEGNSWRVYMFTKSGDAGLASMDFNSKKVNMKGGSVYSEQMRDIKRLMNLAERMDLTLEYGGDRSELNEEAAEFGSVKLEGDKEGISDYFCVDRSSSSMDFKTCLLFCVDMVKNNNGGTGSNLNSFITK